MPVKTGIHLCLRYRGSTWIPAFADLRMGDRLPFDKFMPLGSNAGSDLAGIPPDAPSLHEQFLDLLGDFRRLLDDIDRGLLQLLTA
jgi:hypothetical protein